jgi:hypothetical protein
MGAKYFYCHNYQCRRFQAKSFRVPNSEIAQELNGKKLCKDCYEYGYRLKVGVIITLKQGG